MFQTAGIVILIWLAVGFISGIKIIYIDKEIARMVHDVESGSVELNDSEQRAYEYMDNKLHLYLMVYTLLGFYSFYMDTVNTFRK